MIRREFQRRQSMNNNRRTRHCKLLSCFDEWYKKLFDDFRETCSDNVNERVVAAMMKDSEHLRENPEEIPVLDKVSREKYVFLEPASEDDVQESRLVADVREISKELADLLPSPRPRRARCTPVCPREPDTDLCTEPAARYPPNSFQR